MRMKLAVCCKSLKLGLQMICGMQNKYVHVSHRITIHSQSTCQLQVEIVSEVKNENKQLYLSVKLLADYK
jgi:hypothetical protein